MNYATSLEMSPEEINYLSGLADALEIIVKAEKESLHVGTEYFVLVWDEQTLSTVIQTRKLAKVTITPTRTAYTFTSGKHDKKPVVLYGMGGLASRVFTTLDDAKQGMEHVYLNHTRQY